MRKLREFAKDFLQEEDAVGVVEIILILVVLIGLVMIFKDQLTSLVELFCQRSPNKATRFKATRSNKMK